jgi:hypothetical protein
VLLVESNGSRYTSVHVLARKRVKEESAGGLEVNDN